MKQKEPDKLPSDDVRVRTLVSHLRQFDCLPFPAGPRLPRRYTDRPPLLATGLDAPLRSWMALRLVQEIRGIQIETNFKVPSVNHHIWSALAEWATRHDEGVLALTPMLDDLPLLLQSIAKLAWDSGRPGVDPDFAEALQVTLQEHRAGWRFKRRQEDSSADQLQPFHAHHYDCRCCARPVAADKHEEGQTLAAQHLRFTAAMVKEAQGTWKLLAMLYAKLLLSHLAYTARRQPHREATENFFAAVARLIRQVACRIEDPLAPAAAGLLQVLPRMSPLFCKSGDSGAWMVAQGTLPTCFDPFVLGQEPAVRADALALLASLNLQDADQLPDLVADVADLARETASLLTDPVAAPLLGLQPGLFKNLAQKLKRQRRDFFDLRKPERQALQRGDLFDECCRPPGSSVRVFAPRLRRISEYMHWMDEEGFKAAQVAADAAFDQPALQGQMR